MIFFRTRHSRFAHKPCAAGSTPDHARRNNAKHSRDLFLSIASARLPGIPLRYVLNPEPRVSASRDLPQWAAEDGSFNVWGIQPDTHDDPIALTALRLARLRCQLGGLKILGKTTDEQIDYYVDFAFDQYLVAPNPLTDLLRKAYAEDPDEQCLIGLEAPDGAVTVSALRLALQRPDLDALQILDRAIEGHPNLGAFGDEIEPPHPFTELLREAFAPEMDPVDLYVIGLDSDEIDDSNLQQRREELRDKWWNRAFIPFAKRYHIWQPEPDL